MESRTEKLLGRAAMAVTLMCVAVLGGTAAVLSSHARSPAAAVGYAQGEIVDLPATVYSEGELTLVLIARSSCGASQTGRPFFAQLIARASRVAGIRAVMVSGRNARDDEDRYARAVGLNEAALVRMELSHLRVKEVPTVLLVDRMGRIRYVQSGLPDNAQQINLLRALDDTSVDR